MVTWPMTSRESHVTLKCQISDPNTFRAQYLENGWRYRLETKLQKDHHQISRYLIFTTFNGRDSSHVHHQRPNWIEKLMVYLHQNCRSSIEVYWRNRNHILFFPNTHCLRSSKGQSVYLVINEYIGFVLCSSWRDESVPHPCTSINGPVRPTYLLTWQHHVFWVHGNIIATYVPVTTETLADDR